MTEATPLSSEKKRRPSRKKRIGLTLLFLSAGAFTVWNIFFSKVSPYAFREETTSILKALGGGEEKAQEAYEGASFAFRETASVAGFVDRADRLTETLGPFVRVVAVEEIEELETIRGRTARIEYILEYEETTTSGELSYLEVEDGVWKLLGFGISVPESMTQKVERIDSQHHRIKAPDRVIRLTREVLEDLKEGRAEKVYANASPPFRDSVTLEEFVERQRELDAKLGQYRKLLSVLDNGLNSSKTRARAHLLLDYGNTRTTATIEFIKGDKVWELLRLKITVPEPLLPERDTARVEVSSDEAEP